MAHHYHNEMAESIEHPGDIIGVAALLLTNLMVAGIMSGMNDQFAVDLLENIKLDVANVTKHFRQTEEPISIQ